MNKFKRHLPLLAVVGFAWLMLRPGKASAAKIHQNPGGKATETELLYTEYLTNGDGSPRMDFADWLDAGKPPR